MTYPKIVRGEVRMPVCEWHPTTPRRLNKKEWRACRAGRDAVLVEAAKLAGLEGSIMVVEI
jgi:hypothetical protein